MVWRIRPILEAILFIARKVWLGHASKKTTRFGTALRETIRLFLKGGLSGWDAPAFLCCGGEHGANVFWLALGQASSLLLENRISSSPSFA